MSKTKNRAPDATLCPCGSRAAYDNCCGQWHGGQAAPTAEALMRSRYTAFVLQLDRYLLDTWHPTTRPPSIEFVPNLKWLGLDVRDRSSTGENTAEVAFIARYRIGGGSAARQHERSRFVREADRWFYVDAVQSDA
jgi:SEC-C motif-containing protein